MWLLRLQYNKTLHLYCIDMYDYCHDYMFEEDRNLAWEHPGLPPEDLAKQLG